LASAIPAAIVTVIPVAVVAAGILREIDRLPAGSVIGADAVSVPRYRG